MYLSVLCVNECNLNSLCIWTLLSIIWLLGSLPNTRTYHRECLGAAAALKRKEVQLLGSLPLVGHHASNPRPVVYVRAEEWKL